MAIDTSRSNVLKVYSGRPGCMCGCNGNWTYPVGGQNDVGYEVTQNDRVVSRIYNKVFASDDQQQLDVPGTKCVYVETGTRNYYVYFK